MYHHIWAAAVIQSAIVAAQDDSSSPTNPIQVASAEFLGNITSTNTDWGRDLGFQGQIGSCYINTFGDDFKCDNENPQIDCTFIPTSRNSCAQPMSPTTYKDYFMGRDGSPQPCVSPMGPEDLATPMGITNVIEVAPNKGIVYVLPGHPSKQNATMWQGAGYAIITVDDECNTISVDRPQRSLWNGNLADTGKGRQSFNESLFGDHGALLAQDGYLYVYGSLPRPASDGISLARVKPESATDLNAYEYYNGTAFQTQRIHNPEIVNAVLNQTAQGSAFWSPYYSRYIYLSTAFSTVTARTAVNPWGPWSDSKPIWSLKQMPYRFYAAEGNQELFYTPAWQPKWSKASGSEIVFWVTYQVGKTNVNDHGGHQVGTAVRVNFAGGNSSAEGNTTSGSGGGESNAASPIRSGSSWWSLILSPLAICVLALWCI